MNQSNPFKRHIKEAENLGMIIPKRMKRFLLSLKDENYTHNSFDWVFYGFKEDDTKVLINTGNRDFEGFKGVELAESGIGEFLFIVLEKDNPNKYEDKIYHFLYDCTAMVSGILYPEEKNVSSLNTRFFGVDEDYNWVECGTRKELEQRIE